MTESALLDRLEKATAELHELTLAAFALARAKEKEAGAKLADDDEWTRLPGKGLRCPITNWSRSKINHLIEQGRVRKKRVDGSAFYAGADVRRLKNE